MDFYNFELEYFQSQFERTVEFNLADSSVQCADVRTLLAGKDAAALANLPLYYPEVNGTKALRERIATLYNDAAPANVLVTVGAAQANWLVCNTLLEPGDEVIVISPGYRQVWGLAKNLGCVVKEVQLRPEKNWRLDLSELESLAGRGQGAKLIAIVNPNNPTGSVLSRKEMEGVVRICEKKGAWLHADEVYRGTELSGVESPSFWEMYDRVLCVNSLSKAYGLAGLRIGWILASKKTVEALWRRHEYTVIAAAGPSMKLAEMALERNKRQSLLDRQRKLTHQGHQILESWVREQDGRFSVEPATATSIAFVGYHFDMGSAELADHIRRQVSVLVAPGIYLGTEHHLRIAVGYEAAKLQTALRRITNAVSSLGEKLALTRPAV